MRKCLPKWERAAESNILPEQIAEYEANGGTPQLDGAYTVFGKIVEGLEVVEKIATTQTGAS